MTNPISNLTVQSFPEISRNDRSPNETIWTPKCDRLQVFDMVEEMKRKKSVNPLNTNPTKLSNTLKQFGRNLPTNCLSVFDHFVNFVLKWLIEYFHCMQQNM